MSWNPFKTLNKNKPDLKEFTGLPQKFKDNIYNIKANKITVRYFSDMRFESCQDIIGEIIFNAGYPLIIFNTPFEGAILLNNDCTYRNLSKDGELTIDIVPDYPFGIDKSCDLKRFDGVDYYNNIYEVNILDKSQEDYYKKKYKLFFPIMLNKIPIPIIRLDNADKLLKPVNNEYVKKLSNVSQIMLRTYLRIELLKRTGNKKDGVGWVAIFFIAIGMVIMMIINGFMV